MKTRSILGLCVGFGVLVACALPARRAEAQAGAFGGNYYQFVQVVTDFSHGDSPWQVNTWSAASSAAAASIYGGNAGHLATVTSAGENAFLFSLTSGANLGGGWGGAWLGGTAASPARWLEGPEAGNAMSYTNWNSSEPNNSGLAYMALGSSIPGGGVAGKWSDDSFVNGTPDQSYDRVVGYFIEWEQPSDVPEPATMALMGIVLVGGAMVARRRR